MFPGSWFLAEVWFLVPGSWFLPEVRGQFEAVAYVVPSLAEVGRVHGNKDGGVAGVLGALDQRQRQGAVLVDVELQPQQPARAGGGDLLDGRRGPGAQHHPGRSAPTRYGGNTILNHIYTCGLK